MGGVYLPPVLGPISKEISCDDLPSSFSRWLLAHPRATTTTPSARPIRDRISVFTAELRPSNEVPAIAGAEANGQGRVVVTSKVPRDALGNITGDGTWNVQAVLTGLTDTTVIRASHIHGPPYPSGVNAGAVY